MKKNIFCNDKLFIVPVYILILLTIFPVQLNARSSLEKETAAEVVINFDSTGQVIRGFGAANIIPWRPDMTTNEVNKAFGTGEGQIGFTILRLRIPYNDNESEFSANVPAAKLAESLGAIVIASPWTPPPSLKTNNNIVGGSLKESSYADYAAHLKSFADYMTSQGAPLYAVSLQNEPDANVGYESCFWNATQFLNFCKNNAASVGTRIIMPESENFKHSLSDSTLDDSAAAANVSIIAGHLYGGGLTSYPLAVEKGKEVWMTEHLDTDTSWAHVLATGKEINDCLNAGMNAYVWWYIVRFYGPIDENGNITKRGYVMSQFARFIRPGYVRMYVASNSNNQVYVTAYKSGSKIIIVAVNNNSSPVDQIFDFQNLTGGISNFTPYVTSRTQNCEQQNNIEASNNSLTATLESSSVTTFVSNGSVLPVELLSFSANVSEGNIKLSWVTAAEINNEGFEIERSIDNKKFVKIGFMKGNGTTTDKQIYSYSDYVTGGKFYYRLKQINYNGSFEYSNTIDVSAAPEKFNLFQNYPNPFNPVTKIKYSIPQKSYISLKVYNLLGEEVADLAEGIQQPGNHTVTFDGSNLSSGIYLYQLKADNYSETKKLILLK
jgi:glucuronoarabinoxylan endo-1,4-beta-xylanase